MNERPLGELRPIDVVDIVPTIMEISKVFQKEEAREKVEEYLEVVAKNVNAFNDEFYRIVREGFPSCWDYGGVLI